MGIWGADLTPAPHGVQVRVDATVLPRASSCPCGGETFAVAVGFAMAADDEVRWISLGLRCLTGGVLGVYSDWKIDYVPTAHLLADA